MKTTSKFEPSFKPLKTNRLGGASSTAIALMVVLGLIFSSLGTEAAKINPSTSAASSLGGKAEIKRSGSNWGYREGSSPQTKDDLAHSVRRNWMDNFTEWELGQFIRCLNDCQPWLFSDFGSSNFYDMIGMGRICGCLNW
ncbi:uncharacterized protein LOC142335513 isoform X1 [Convolutriloba macropyga]|uniref:uncharacterized protein LOC142335513 isoform X1 n=1 Tax=Convolutriloba macropyga TaxID=536237 RepID=UPI003F5248FA